MQLLYPIIQVLFVILIAPFFTGVIRKIKAWSQHRRGLPVLQLYYDIIKLFKKDVVVPGCSSWIFKAAPYVYFVSILACCIFIPVIPQFSSFNFAGDAVFIIYLLAAGRFFLALAGLDAGSTFGGMGSSREMMISSLMEPSMLIIVFTLGLRPAVNSTAMNVLYEGSLKAGAGIISPMYLLLLAAMMIILIAETARIPVDDPATHLELTMVHEAMVLEYSGRYLALIQLASSLKQLLFIILIANLFLPFGSSNAFGAGLAATLAFFLLKALIITIAIGFIEINSVKLRLFSIPNLAALAFILSVLGFMAGFVFGR